MNENLLRMVVGTLAMVVKNAGCELPTRETIIRAVSMGTDGSHTYN